MLHARRNGRRWAAGALLAAVTAVGLWSFAQDGAADPARWNDQAVLDWYRGRHQAGYPAGSGVDAETYRIVFGGVPGGRALEEAVAQPMRQLVDLVNPLIDGRAEAGLLVGAARETLRVDGFTLTPTRCWRPARDGFEDAWILEWTLPSMGGLMDPRVAEWVAARLDGFGAGAWAYATRTGGGESEDGARAAAIVYQGTR